jgi:hypothetical protein
MRNEEKHEWDRQSGESSKAYAHFCLYRDMGVSRSIRQMPSVSGCTSVVRQLNRWSSRWRWVERCQKYDDYLEYQDRLRQEKERRQMRERHAKMAVLGQSIAVKGLENLLAKVQGGDQAVAPGDLTRLLDTSVKVERQSRGESTDSHEVSGPSGGPVKLDLQETLKRIDEVYGLKTEDGTRKALGPGDGSDTSES